jgi:hypothetical protein
VRDYRRHDTYAGACTAWRQHACSIASGEVAAKVHHISAVCAIATCLLQQGSLCGSHRHDKIHQYIALNKSGGYLRVTGLHILKCTGKKGLYKGRNLRWSTGTWEKGPQMPECIDLAYAPYRFSSYHFLSMQPEYALVSDVCVVATAASPLETPRHCSLVQGVLKRSLYVLQGGRHIRFQYKIKFVLYADLCMPAVSVSILPVSRTVVCLLHVLLHVPQSGHAYGADELTLSLTHCKSTFPCVGYGPVRCHCAVASHSVTGDQRTSPVADCSVELDSLRNALGEVPACEEQVTACDDLEAFDARSGLQILPVRSGTGR